MRSGACTVQQTLTTEAASVLKHSLSLARRRGHAQVSPLHVAATLLSSRNSLLRRACLKSQPHQTSHPLQCRALELCFNVALNRLPTTPGPLLHCQPSLSNALIAALKRAQAHQRRGCIEQQHPQPLLTIKVELEQLIISILDDPSVSRVMREAGFSSTDVKKNIEDCCAASVFQCYSTSDGVFSSPCSPSPAETINPSTFWQTHFLTCNSDPNPFFISPQKKNFTGSICVKEDVKIVLEVFLRKKRRNTAIVGDCMSITEGLVGELLGRLERGEVPEELKQAHFFKFQFAPISLRFLKKEDVEMNLSELKRKVDSFGEGGAIIYTGDLKWTVDGSSFMDGEASDYNPVDHLVTGMGRLLSEYSRSNAKVWLMATASYQTYMRCQMRQPPLEIQWALQAVSVPSGGLGLSLHASSAQDSRLTLTKNPSQVLEMKPFSGNRKEELDNFACCPECTSNYEKEVQLLSASQQKHLPSWFRSQGITNTDQKDGLIELRRKWNRLCHSLHHQAKYTRSRLNMGSIVHDNQRPVGESYSYAYSSYPCWSSQKGTIQDSISISSVGPSLNSNQKSNHVPKFRRQQSCNIEFNFVDGIQKSQPGEPSLVSLKDNTNGKEDKITLALGNSLLSDLGKLEKGGKDHLCKSLQENVPWQSAVIPSVVEALVESKAAKTEAWLLIEGNDTRGKRRLALSLAESVLGSADLLLHLNMRERENEVDLYSEMLTRSLKIQERQVVLVENIDSADNQFLTYLANGFETGSFGESSKREGSVGRAIFILTRGDHTMYGDKKASHDSVIQMTLRVNETTTATYGRVSTDQKRKAEWDITSKSKSPRTKEKENKCWAPLENGNKSEDLSRQSSFGSLDLNIKADEEDESGSKAGELSPNSSDLTRDTTLDPHTPRGFLDLIKNRLIFDQNESQEGERTQDFFSNMMKGFAEVFGEQSGVCFSIEERVLEEVRDVAGCSGCSMFERWVSDIFQKSLRAVKFGGKGGTGLRLCFGGMSDKILEDGFMGTCLPKKIELSLVG